MKRAEIKQTIKQIIDGKRYEGTLEMGDGTINYEIEFTTPIPALDAMIEPEDISGLRQVVVIKTRKKDGMDVKLSDDDYRFFFSLLATLAIDFYNLPQTRDQNRDYLYSAKALHGELKCMPGNARFELRSSIPFFQFPLDVCEMLSKFGCII